MTPLSRPAPALDVRSAVSDGEERLARPAGPAPSGGAY